MIGEQGVEFGTAMDESMKAGEKNWREKEEELMEQMSKLGIRQPSPESQAGPSSDRTNVAVTERATEQDKRGYRNAYVSRHAIALCRKALYPIMVRRTGRSLKPDGTPVLSLNRYVESKVWTVLTPREQKVLDRLADDLIVNKGSE